MYGIACITILYAKLLTKRDMRIPYLQLALHSCWRTSLPSSLMMRLCKRKATARIGHQMWKYIRRTYTAENGCCTGVIRICLECFDVMRRCWRIQNGLTDGRTGRRTDNWVCNCRITVGPYQYCVRLSCPLQCGVQYWVHSLVCRYM